MSLLTSACGTPAAGSLSCLGSILKVISNVTQADVVYIKPNYVQVLEAYEHISEARDFLNFRDAVWKELFLFRTMVRWARRSSHADVHINTIRARLFTTRAQLETTYWATSMYGNDAYALRLSLPRSHGVMTRSATSMLFFSRKQKWPLP